MISRLAAVVLLLVGGFIGAFVVVSLYPGWTPQPSSPSLLILTNDSDKVGKPSSKLPSDIAVIPRALTDAPSKASSQVLAKPTTRTAFSSCTRQHSLHDFYTFEGRIQGFRPIPAEDAALVPDPEALPRRGRGPHIDERPNATEIELIRQHVFLGEEDADACRRKVLAMPDRAERERLLNVHNDRAQPAPPPDWLERRRSTRQPSEAAEIAAGGRDEQWIDTFDPATMPEFVRPLFFSERELRWRKAFDRVHTQFPQRDKKWATALGALLLQHSLGDAAASNASDDDGGDADERIEIPPWRPGRARPILCQGRHFYSAYFSIPEENILSAERERTVRRTQDWATILPGKKSTYIFKSERAYREDMEMSLLSLTRRKFGWVTSRNMEILAAGSVPYFCGIDKMPKVGTLRHLPLELLHALVLALPGVRVTCNPPKKAVVLPLRRPHFNETQFRVIARKLLRFTRSSLTTTLHARYVLSATSLPALPKRVLLVWSMPYSILITGLIHGLRGLGVEVVDVPRRREIYRGPECDAAKSKTYAKGWFFFCRTNESAGVSRSNIAERIARKEFDVVLFGISDYWTYHMLDPFEELPYFSHVVRHYSRDRVIVINDADLLRPMTTDVSQRLLQNYSLVFRRETHTCGQFS